VVVDAADNVNGLLGTAGAKLDGYGEEVGAGGFCDSVAAVDTGEVDKAGLDDALLAVRGLDDLLGESILLSWKIGRFTGITYR